MKLQVKELCSATPEFLKWLADIVSHKTSSDALYYLAKNSRHLFGNPKAARKTAWEDATQMRDEL